VIATFPYNYPDNYPVFKVECYDKFFHPNVYQKDGIICGVTLRKVDPNTTIRKRIDALIEILSTPNPDSSANPTAGSLYQKDYHEYYRQALYKFRGLTMIL
jgi:ubiquitin-protein ligase